MNLIFKQNKLYVITEMPDNPKDYLPDEELSPFPSPYAHDALVKYQQALLSAPSIEVENEDDVHFYICKSDDHFDGLLKEGQVYSLPDDKFKYEVKSILQSRYGTEWYDLPGQTEGRDPEGIYRTISVAIISEVTPKEESQDELNLKSMKDNELKPIPLTEEWLLNFGFEKKGAYKWDHDLLPNYLMTYPSGYTIEGVSIVLQYVHQLQNLYFALTGEELTILSEPQDKIKVNCSMEKPDFEKIASENHNVLYEDMYQGFIMGANHAWEILSAEIEKLEKDNEDLTQWKESEMKIWQPVIDFAQSNKLPGLGLGQSISEYVLKTLKSAAKSQSEPQQQK